MERFANNASSTLASSIGSGDGTLDVASATAFPNSGNFRLACEAELLLVTAVAGATFTVTRGVEGTTAASHPAGAAVVHVLTAASVQLASGGGLPAFLQLTPPPVLANWSWFNQGGSTASDLSAGIFLQVPATSGDNIRGLTRPLASPTTYTITALFTPYWSGETFARIGMGLTDGTQLVMHWFDSANSMINLFFSCQKWNSATSFYSESTTGRDLLDSNALFWGADLPTWFRIRDDGSTIHFEVSKDYMKWWKSGSVGNTAFLNPPTAAGIFIDRFEAGKDNAMSLLSWAEE